MLIVSGNIELDPANHDKFVGLVGPLVEATLAEEGNITYGFWAHPAQPGVFHVYEEWADQDAMDQHMVSPHMAEFLGSMGEVGVTGTEIIRHDVSESSKLM